MQLSRFQPLKPSTYFKQIINDVVLLQRHRYLKVERPSLNKFVGLNKAEDECFNFTRSVQPVQQLVKRKIIKKVKSEQIDIKRQKKAQRIHSLNLLFRLNRFILNEADKYIPPSFSILDSKDEGDYLEEEGQKKEYPHYSNTLKLTQIPMYPTESFPKPSFLPKLRKISSFEKTFSIEDSSVLKVRQIYAFLDHLFRQGNKDFEKISTEMQISESKTKILYDFFNDYFEVESQLDLKSEDQRKKYLNMVKEILVNALTKFKKRDNTIISYIPFEQEFMSLKQLRDCLQLHRDCQINPDSESEL